MNEKQILNNAPEGAEDWTPYAEGIYLKDDLVNWWWFPEDDGEGGNYVLCIGS